MNITFFIPKHETIPTQLRLRVDGEIDVYYERLWNEWEFKFFKSQGVTFEMAASITDEIVSKIISQSYDHGAQLRECGVRSVVDDIYEYRILVHFRVRDAM